MSAASAAADPKNKASTVTHLLTTLVADHGYLAVFVLMVLESACIPVPSEAVMPFGGALAAGVLAGSAHPHVTVIGVALAGAVGNLVGSLIAYAIGRFGGRAFIGRWGRYVLLRPDHLDHAHHFFARRGISAVLIARVLPVIRTFISLPAGAARMRVMPFAALTLAGSLPWTFGLAYAGYALAGNWQTVSSYVTPVAVGVAVIAVVVAVRWIVRERRQRAVTSPTPDEGSDTSTAISPGRWRASASESSPPS